MNHYDYSDLHALVFQEDYPGYKPYIVESPNGDGKFDVQKRYAHVTVTNLQDDTNPSRVAILERYFLEGFQEAVEAARALGLEPRFMPDARRCAMRVLEYPPGAVSEPHTDFDLFTVQLYRNQVHSLVPNDRTLQIGELYEIITHGARRATRHSVMADGRPQLSIVFFAMPPFDEMLPNGQLVSDWVAERISRSRLDTRAA